MAVSQTDLMTPCRRPVLADILLVDSSGLLAALDKGERQHRLVTQLLKAESRTLVTTDFVLAEVDYLILTRLGPKAEQSFIRQLVGGAFTRELVTDVDLIRAHAISTRYQEHALGLTDATLMALSERLNVKSLLTLDHRHFAMFRNKKGHSLELLP